MDHRTIEDSDLVEAYVTGRLADTERTEFETAPRGLPGVPRPGGGHPGSGRGPARAGSCGLPGEDGAEVTPVVPRQGMGARRLGRGAPGDWMGSADRRRLEQTIETESAGRSAAEAHARELAQRPPEASPTVAAPPPSPPGPVPVLMLVATRGSDLPTLALRQEAGPVVLSVERESPPRFSRYQVRLSSEGGGAVLRRFPPSSRDAVVLAMDASLLPPGTYTIALEGETASGRRTQLPGHRFRVVR